MTRHEADDTERIACGHLKRSSPSPMTLMFESKIAITAIISTGSIMNEIKCDQNLM
jgi:hypothetical protein